MSRSSKSVESYMPLWIADYLADTQHLTRDEHGAYLLLLMAYWRKGEPLADDDRKLAAIAKASPAEWRRLRPVLSEFFQVGDGVWKQKRVDAELARAKAIRAKRSEAGAKGADGRWQTDDKPMANAMANAWQNDAISPSPSPFEPNGSNIDTSPAEPSVDLGAVAEAYNAVASDCGWPLCQALNAQRRASAKARLAEAGGIDGWRHAMAKARASPFLRGETGRSAGHENWRPDIDFFLKPKTFTKLMEGGYDGQQGHRTGTAPGRGKPAISPGWLAGAVSAIETLESCGVAD